MNTQERIFRDISDFIYIDDPLSKANLIIVVGSSNPALSLRAAELYHLGYAKQILAGGMYSLKYGHFAKEKLEGTAYEGMAFPTEADFESFILRQQGVPEEAILYERYSTNTAENASFAAKEVKRAGLLPKTIIIVCKDFHARRCLMTFSHAFPNAKLLICPVPAFDFDKTNWFSCAAGRLRVLGEL